MFFPQIYPFSFLSFLLLFVHLHHLKLVVTLLPVWYPSIAHCLTPHQSRLPFRACQSVSIPITISNQLIPAPVQSAFFFFLLVPSWNLDLMNTGTERVCFQFHFWMCHLMHMLIVLSYINYPMSYSKAWWKQQCSPSAYLISLYQVSNERKKNTGHSPLPNQTLGFVHPCANYWSFGCFYWGTK